MNQMFLFLEPKILSQYIYKNSNYIYTVFIM